MGGYSSGRQQLATSVIDRSEETSERKYLMKSQRDLRKLVDTQDVNFLSELGLLKTV